MIKMVVWVLSVHINVVMKNFLTTFQLQQMISKQGQQAIQKVRQAEKNRLAQLGMESSSTNNNVTEPLLDRK